MQEITSKEATIHSHRHSAQEPVKRQSPNLMPLNFKVPQEFRREFKTYAAQHDLKLNQLLFDAFAALKEKDAK